MKKKKKKLKKLKEGSKIGPLVQLYMIAKGKRKKSDAGKIAVAGMASEMIHKGAKKMYNKAVAKINKKRGY
tara:strand:+ start:3081 stop:3293 length:213 start_codon:yes stop_codon:yes gene_type:complete